MKNTLFKKIQALFLRRKKSLTPGDVASLVKSNAKEEYDALWSNKDLLEAYMVPNRLKGQTLIADFVLSKGVTGKVVDIGFGSGDFLRVLNEKSTDDKLTIYGLDYSKAAVARAKRIIPQGNFIAGEAYKLPYDDNFFDLVACLQTLEHLDNPQKAVKEFDRVCAPGGLILISIPNGDLDDFEGHVNFWNSSQFKEFLAPRIIVDCIHFNDNRAFFVTFNPLKILNN